MRKLDASNFIYETSIDDICGSEKEHIRWKDEVIKILKEIFREDLGILCSNISNQLEECLDTKRRIISYNRGVDKTFNAKVKTKEELKDYQENISYVESQIRQSAKNIENSTNIKTSKDNLLKLEQLYDAYEKFEKYLDSKESSKNFFDSQYKYNESNFIEMQVLYNKQLNILVNMIKELKSKEANGDINVNKIVYTRANREKLDDLMIKLPITQDKHEYFVKLIEEYIRSRRQELTLILSISDQILQDPNMISYPQFENNKLYRKFKLCEQLEDMFFIGPSGYQEICVTDAYSDGTRKAVPLTKTGVSRINEKLYAMKLANDFLEVDEIDKDKVDTLSIETSDPMILDLTFNMQLVYDDNLKKR